MIIETIQQTPQAIKKSIDVTGAFVVGASWADIFPKIAAGIASLMLAAWYGVQLYTWYENRKK